MYVLDAVLQDGKKTPKWNPQACLGMFVGFSPVHSSLVPLVLNVRTGKISPQYHVVFDDKFSTVNSLPSNECLNEQWARIFKLGKECYLDLEYDGGGGVSRHPIFHRWIKSGCLHRNQQILNQLSEFQREHLMKTQLQREFSQSQLVACQD